MGGGLQCFVPVNKECSIFLSLNKETPFVFFFFFNIYTKAILAGSRDFIVNLILHWGPPKVWVLGDGGGCFIPQGSREWWGLAREGAPRASAHVSPRPTSPQRPQWAERRPPVHAPPRSALRQSGPPPSLSANSVGSTCPASHLRGHSTPLLTSLAPPNRPCPGA